MAKYPAIPYPQPDVQSLHDTVLALKEAIEILTSQRGTRATGVCTLQDLVDMGLVEADQLPSGPAS